MILGLQEEEKLDLLIQHLIQELFLVIYLGLHGEVLVQLSALTQLKTLLEAMFTLV